MNKMQRALILFLSLLTSPFCSAAEWPQFRGPQGAGTCAAADFPTHFGPDSNVVWKTTVPSGHSSPIVAGKRIFLTGFEKDALVTLCLNRDSGEVLWHRTLKPRKIERGARHSHPATSTPCTDGAAVYVYFGSFGVLAYSMDGEELWRTPLPDLVTQHGASSSPVLAGDSVVLQRDADVDSHLLALRKFNGEAAWKKERTDARRSFSTPLVLARHGGEEIVVAGTLRVASYDSRSGNELWTVRGIPNEMCSSPVSAGESIYVAGWTHGSGVSTMPSFDSLLERGDDNKDGALTQAEAPSGPAKQHFQYIDANKDGVISRQEWTTMADVFSRSENAALAIRRGGRGDITSTHVTWKQTRGMPYVPTPLVYEGRFYMIKNGGLLTCLKVEDGAALYQEERIGALGDYYASPVAAGGKVLVISQSGMATVVSSSDALKVLARNALGETTLATPALSGNQVYIRTATALYAFSGKRSDVINRPSAVRQGD